MLDNFRQSLERADQRTDRPETSVVA
jgi:hypothetical protein